MCPLIAVSSQQSAAAHVCRDHSSAIIIDGNVAEEGGAASVKQLLPTLYRGLEKLLLFVSSVVPLACIIIVCVNIKYN